MHNIEHLAETWQYDASNVGPSPTRVGHQHSNHKGYGHIQTGKGVRTNATKQLYIFVLFLLYGHIWSSLNSFLLRFCYVLCCAASYACMCTLVCQVRDECLKQCYYQNDVVSYLSKQLSTSLKRRDGLSAIMYLDMLKFSRSSPPVHVESVYPPPPLSNTTTARASVFL
jgi:hypothetical protein